MTITLINSFIVPADQDEAFQTTWRSEIGHFQAAPGFIEAKLHRNLGLKDRTFAYVNVALWESFEAYQVAFRDYTPPGQRVPGVTAHPGLFEVQLEVHGPARGA